MSKPTSERRPPKLNGYEDHDILEILAQVMLDKPELTVTAAIKSLGITDTPSVKRIREKHSAAVRVRAAIVASPDNGRVIMFPAGASVAPMASDPSQSANHKPEAPIPAANDAKPVAATSDSPEMRKRIRDDMASASLPSAPFGAAVMLPDEFYQSGGAGVKAWVAAIEMQQMMWFDLLRTLPMAAALRNQMLMCEWTMSACRRQPKTPKD